MKRVPIAPPRFSLKSPRSVDEAVEAFDVWLAECRRVLEWNLTAALEDGELDDPDDIAAALDEADAAYDFSREEFRRGLLAAIAPVTVH